MPLRPSSPPPAYYFPPCLGKKEGGRSARKEGRRAWSRAGVSPWTLGHLLHLPPLPRLVLPPTPLALKREPCERRERRSGSSFAWARGVDWHLLLRSLPCGEYALFKRGLTPPHPRGGTEGPVAGLTAQSARVSLFKG